ncbi:MAG: ribonuclease III [Paludibacteraceae bacterium]|nr:ribonuclease III [Paludibacteraceae bacterium]MBR6686225.1 ribonuclease III [Paludibacteraceae bacterium]
MIRALIQRIKLPANQRKNYSKLKNILGFSPRKWDYYQLALTHSSTYNSNKSRLQNNERLEFLGDSVLGTIVSEILYENYSNKREGELTNLRSKIVQRATLDDLAVRIGLNKLVTSQEHTAQFKAHINGNAFEALMGAIFMDRGYKKSKKFILKLIKEKHIDIEKLSKKEINFKSKFIEWTQHRKVDYEFIFEPPIYEKSTNSSRFTTKLKVEGILVGTGTGYTKKEAQQLACKSAMIRIKQKSFKKELSSIKPDISVIKDPNNTNINN